MKKILIAFDDGHFSDGAFEAARFLNQMEPVLLVGLFLPSVYYANTAVGAEEMEQPFYSPMIEEGGIDEIENSAARFREKCIENKIRYVVHGNLADAVLPSIKIETRFADLMIIGGETFYQNLGNFKPNPYLRYAMHEAECPVLIVPEKFCVPSSNILTYDGNQASVYAIKQFKYLFPQFWKNKTLLFHASQKKGAVIPDSSLIEEFVTISFPDYEVWEADFDAHKYLGTWISEKEGSILISGSYGRSELSQIFKESFVAEVIGEHYAPVFIAHK